VHVLQLGSSVRSIFNMALIAVLDAQIKSKNIDTDEIVKNSPWWKRFKKVSKDI
jgi:malate dehydrogenase (oxaloacetate-decarboxylating)(NADP+)